MKRILSILLCLVLLGSVAAAETFLDGSETRNIQIDKADTNDPIPGESPVTGRNLAEVAASAPAGFLGQAISGRYMPIIVQIDNTEGGLGISSSTGKANRAPWGVQFTDVIYETPLYKDGVTRLSFLYSDLMPTAVGPCRSARAFHAWLREEWDCGFSFYGQQEYQIASNVPAIFKSTGADKKANGLLLFSGTVGDTKPWKQYYGVYNGISQNFPAKRPHHVTVDVAALSTLIPYDFEAANHTWLFTDDLPEEGDDAEVIYVNWAKGSNKIYNSILEYDEDDECYYRYMLDSNGKEHEYMSHFSDINGVERVPFANVIVQFTPMQWLMKDAPYPTVLGTGNADYFMGGKHMAGVWNRDELSDRTVFYGEDGEEIELQRGRTLIIVMDYEFADEGRSISYE